jgi:four helix bundle protein
MLDFERLDVYQCALRFAALSFQILENMPRGHGELSDQLRRATISIPLNIAEGAGKPTEGDRARYHAIARGSAMECAAIVDLLRLQSLVQPAVADEAKTLLVRVVSMLTKLCR